MEKRIKRISFIVLHKESSSKTKNKIGSENIVDFAMRYGNPSIKLKLHELKSQGCENVAILPLYHSMQQLPQLRFVMKSTH